MKYTGIDAAEVRPGIYACILNKVVKSTRSSLLFVTPRSGHRTTCKQGIRMRWDKFPVTAPTHIESRCQHYNGVVGSRKG
jgi:hypothetical protein